MTGSNLLLFTGYSGIDPEIAFGGTEFGRDQYDVYPRTKNFYYWIECKIIISNVIKNKNMRRYIALTLFISLFACTNLDETIYDRIPADKFPEMRIKPL